MKEVIDDGVTRLFLDEHDPCAICGNPREDMYFTWNVFHGEATASCCGATYQVKDYHIENPSESKKEVLALLRGKWIECKIKNEWISHLKTALVELGARSIDERVIQRAQKLLKEDYDDRCR